MSNQKKLLDWLGSVESGMLLESQIVGSGLNRALDELLIARKVTLVDHPTVKERGQIMDIPATAVILLKDDR